MKPSRAVCASVAIEPVSNDMLLEQARRGPRSRHLDEGDGRGLGASEVPDYPITSDEAPASSRMSNITLESHHSPDISMGSMN